jgi:hypothetical protein
MSQESMEVVRKPLRVRQQSRRSIDQRVGIRFPRLFDASARLISRLPPSSRIRHAALWRGTQLGMEAFNRRDLDAAVLPGHADFEYCPPREFVEVGFFEPCYRGPAGFREFVLAWSDVLGADLRVEPVELIDLGHTVVLLAELPMRGRASRVPFTGTIATVSELKDGKATRVHAYLHHAEALAAAGLSE